MYSLRTLFIVLTIAAVAASLVTAHSEWIAITFLAAAFFVVVTAFSVGVALYAGLIYEWRQKMRLEKRK